MRLPHVETGSVREGIASFAAIVRDATLVALSEAVHGAAEPLEFRNRLFQYLVQEKGFTAIALESGLVESRAVHEYVRGGPAELAAVLSCGLSWNFDALPQNRQLIEWLRLYNAAARGRKVNFYGFDVAGSPGNSRARLGVDVALNRVLEYLREFDDAAYRRFRARLGGLIENLSFAFCQPPHAAGYHRLTQRERDTMTAVIQDIEALLKKQGQWQVRSEADYEWACQSAACALQADAWLRQIPIGWQPAAEPQQFPSQLPRFFAAATNVRDRAQADNLDWIIQREGSCGKLLVFASRFHLSATPVHTPWSERAGPGQLVAGTYLRKRYGGRLVSIGNLISSGVYFDGQCSRSIEQPSAESLDSIAARVGVPRFALDLRAAPDSVRLWLDRDHILGSRENEFRLNLARAFDVLLYMEAVTAAAEPVFPRRPS